MSLRPRLPREPLSLRPPPPFPSIGDKRDGTMWRHIVPLTMDMCSNTPAKRFGEQLHIVREGALCSPCTYVRSR